MLQVDELLSLIPQLPCSTSDLLTRCADKQTRLLAS